MVPGVIFSTKSGRHLTLVNISYITVATMKTAKLLQVHTVVWLLLNYVLEIAIKVANLSNYDNTIQINVNHGIVATAIQGDHKTPDGEASKKAELLMKYKKQNRKASVSKTNKSLNSKSIRNPLLKVI